MASERVPILTRTPPRPHSLLALALPLAHLWALRQHIRPSVQSLWSGHVLVHDGDGRRFRDEPLGARELGARVTRDFAEPIDVGPVLETLDVGGEGTGVDPHRLAMVIKWSNLTANSPPSSSTPTTRAVDDEHIREAADHHVEEIQSLADVVVRAAEFAADGVVHVLVDTAAMTSKLSDGHAGRPRNGIHSRVNVVKWKYAKALGRMRKCTNNLLISIITEYKQGNLRGTTHPEPTPSPPSCAPKCEASLRRGVAFGPRREIEFAMARTTQKGLRNARFFLFLKKVASLQVADEVKRASRTSSVRIEVLWTGNSTVAPPASDTRKSNTTPRFPLLRPQTSSTSRCLKPRAGSAAAPA
ncbi:hypothetical protein BDK51DRAFT_50628 [Blyttiomyces helicus]|uniref:Uncharacterized protein n=1 Tax=Blyttiomyces helicus TaxID=388810 RepID=A0A4P9WII7_9FUNG|nr:hypothetical protein BDK51DRAFT_50628 [Blyttiomyces helicus]|eukprot:RKO92689.1 hypothetical protein BDK51DRAFT_50628 [Blyttiomyces helicus]